MGAIAWHAESTKQRLEALVREVESKSSAELVLVVRPQSGSYRAADLTLASIFAFFMLCIYVYAPIEFTDDLAPPSILLVFFAAFFFSSRVPAARRLLSRKRQRQAQTHDAACAAFVAQGISCTRDRTGILIYVSKLEQSAEVIVDIGILRREDDHEPSAAIRQIKHVIESGQDLEALEKAIRKLGTFLAEKLPPRLDDQNELADEVNVA